MQIAVVGVGAMGRGIAQVAASAGHDVALYDAAEGAAEAALGRINSGLQETVDRGKLTQGEAEAAQQRLARVAALSELASAEIVIEAVSEDLAIKQQLFQKLEAIVHPTALLASNTSSLAIGAIAAGMKDRTRLVGLHFFNPVPAMRLVEIVGRKHTPESVLQNARNFVAGIGKTGVAVSDSPGFLVNHAGRAFVTEALYITRDAVATVDEVDRIARDVLGFRIGPFQLMDLTGIDVNYPVTENVFTHNFAEPRLASTWYHRYLLETEDLGRKTGAGFYDYGESEPDASVPRADLPDPGAVPTVDVAGSAVLKQIAADAGLTHPGDAAAELILVDPLGDDLVTHALNRGLDPKRVVGIDTLLPDPAVFTVMVGPGTNKSAVSGLVRALEASRPVVLINDSPGFIAQRLLATIMNLGCEIAQQAIATPGDIDEAVRLGLRYPHGPLEWADLLGVGRALELCEGIHRSTADPRYRPSPWLRRRAHAGLPCGETDFVLK